MIKRILKFISIAYRKPIWLIQNNKVPFSSYIQTTSAMRNCIIGEHCYISGFCGLNHVIMGNYCSIGPSVLIGNMEHSIEAFSTSPSIFSEGKHDQETLIGNDVWIGAQSFIKIGVSIGDGAVIGAQSFVNKDVPPYAIVVGTPARILKYRFDEDIRKKIQKTKYWTKDPETARDLLSKIPKY